MRLAKYLAHAGVASRRAAETLVRAGRVRVDGEMVRDPARDVGDHSRIELDGHPLAGAQETVVYALHKPVGVLSTAHDPQGRPTVVGLIPDSRRLYPVGRLDADSSGLILLTNDGDLANRLTHPRYEVPKTYRVRVAAGPVSEGTLGTLRRGVTLEDGPTGPASVRCIGRGGEELEITIGEGRNRQVRRMCEVVGHRALALRRVALGPLRLGALAPGEHRRLGAAEVEALRAASATRGDATRGGAASGDAAPGGARGGRPRGAAREIRGAL
ncbi:MAG TPA: pseudouridine synthase [Solirubrobacteraceae bacterium]